MTFTARLRGMAATIPWNRIAPFVLLASIGLSIASSASANAIDLRTYIAGGAALSHPASLYKVVLIDPLGNFPTPFVYPPFAAIMFYPLHFLPLGLVITLWRLGVIAALYTVIRLSLRMINQENATRAMLWTAGVLWLEPIVGNIKTATIGTFLMLLVVGAASTTRWWLSGLLVGLGAGMKLTPAISGVYLAGMRRWWAAAMSAVVFVATLVWGWLATGDQVRFFFTDYIRRDNLFRFSIVENQSWRGAIARVTGGDGKGVWLILAITVTAVLAILAWRALDGDRLGSLLVVMVFGLLASPVSWTNHWVWMVPLLIWLLHGSWSTKPGARTLFWLWLATGFLAIPNALTYVHQHWLVAVGGLVYELLALATFAWMIAQGRMNDGVLHGDRVRGRAAQLGH